MSTPHNPGDPSSQPSANQPWGQQSANQPEGQPWGQQSADPYAGQQQWGDQNQPTANQWGGQQPAADQWGGQQQQPTADQWAGQQADPYAGQYAGQQADPYAGQYAQQQWNGQPQKSGLLTNDGKNFFGSLFDFSFQSFVTPKIVKIVYIIVTAVIGLSILFAIIVALASGEAAPIIGSLILGPLVGLIYLSLARMTLELYYAVIRLSEDVHERLPRQ